MGAWYSAPVVKMPPDVAKARLESMIGASKVVMFTKDWCPYCRRARSLFASLNVPVDEHNIGYMNDGGAIFEEITKSQKGWDTVPAIYIDKSFVGGCDDVTKLHSEGKLKKLLGLP